jgi:protease-4
MKRSRLIWILAVAGVLVGAFSLILVAGVLLFGGEGGFGGTGGQRLAVIPIEGVITEETARSVNRYLKQYGNDRRVAAIILRIDSPGGGVAASQEIYREVLRAKAEKGKKIVVSMGTVAASGGYYIASPADRILANPGTVTGSIGVIAEWVNVRDLAAWAKIRPEVFKSGEFKDTGSPTRDLTEPERKYFQGLIDELYEQFVRAVLEGRRGRRDLDEARLRALADGRIYTGQSALDQGLIDELGNYEDALRATARLVGLRGEPQVITPPRPRTGFSLLDLLGRTRFEQFLPSRWQFLLNQIDKSVRLNYILY